MVATYNIVYNNVWARLDPKPQVGSTMYNALKDGLRYRPKGYQHTWNYQKKKWDGYDYVIDLPSMAFKSGLIKAVTDIIQGQKEQVQYIPEDIPLPDIIDKPLSIDGRIKRYPHQEELYRILQLNQEADQFEFNTGVGSGLEPVYRNIFSSPTGTGKTIMMADAASVHQTKSLILVADIVLLDQTKNALEKFYDTQIGMIGDGEFDIQDITVATLQSACSILGLRNKGDKKGKRDKLAPKLDHRKQKFLTYVQSVGTVVHDEVHYAENDSVSSFYEYLTAARYVYGFSATPYKWLRKIKAVKNILLEQHFGRLGFNADSYDFVDMGLTVPLLVWAIPMPIRCDGFKTYNQALSKQVVEHPERTELVVEAAKNTASQGHSCFVYFRRVKHAKILQEAWGDDPPPIISGKTPRKKRNELFEALGKKDICAVISDIGAVGLDIRSLDSVALASPVQDIRQLKGRVCRACPEVGKKAGTIIDPVDRTNILKKHWRARYNQYKSDENKVVGCEP